MSETRNQFVVFAINHSGEIEFARFDNYDEALAYLVTLGKPGELVYLSSKGKIVIEDHG